MTEELKKDHEKIAKSEYGYRLHMLEKIHNMDLKQTEAINALDLKYERRMTRVEVKSGFWGMLGAIIVVIFAKVQKLM